MNDGADAYGFSRDKENPNLLSKKYDPHAANRRKSYEASQAAHHRARMTRLKEGNGNATVQGGRSTNKASTFEDRRRAVLEKKERLRNEKIAKAKRSSDMVKKRLKRKEEMEREKSVAGKAGYDVSSVVDGEVVELEDNMKGVSLKDKGSVKRGETGGECATCRGREELEEDKDNKGVFYCRKCWEEWEGS